MYTSRTLDTICLNVAIDYRIRALFQPVLRIVGSESIGGHVLTVRALGYNLRANDAKTNVIGQLA